MRVALKRPGRRGIGRYSFGFRDCSLGRRGRCDGCLGAIDHRVHSVGKTEVACGEKNWLTLGIEVFDYPNFSSLKNDLPVWSGRNKIIQS